MKPIIQKRDKNLSVSVFVNQTEDGKSFISFTAQRSYKKKGEEEWTRETIHLNKEEALPFAQIISDAYSDAVKQQALPKLVSVNTVQDQPVQANTTDDDIPF